MPKYVLAVDLGGTKCAAASVDRDGRILSRRVEPVDLASPSAPIKQIHRLGTTIADGRSPAEFFAAVSVAVPGLVRRDGTVWAPNLPGWERMPLARRLHRLFQTPIIVESDRNAAVLGECWRGAARGKSDVIVLIVGTGIGAGILSGGRLVRGAHELSGCAGWLSVDGEASVISKRIGQLESLCAGPAVANLAHQHLQRGAKSSLQTIEGKPFTAQQVAEAARQGDRLAKDVFAQAGRWLGFGVANLVSLFDPEIIVLSGGMAGSLDLYSRDLSKAMLSRAQPLAARAVKIRVSRLGADANLIGCAKLGWQRVESNPDGD